MVARTCRKGCCEFGSFCQGYVGKVGETASRCGPFKPTRCLGTPGHSYIQLWFGRMGNCFVCINIVFLHAIRRQHPAWVRPLLGVFSPRYRWDDHPIPMGVFFRRGLGKLNAEELKDTCYRLKAVGFGPGHTCALRMLAMSAAVTLKWSEGESEMTVRIFLKLFTV